MVNLTMVNCMFSKLVFVLSHLKLYPYFVFMIFVKIPKIKTALYFSYFNEPVSMQFAKDAKPVFLVFTSSIIHLF